ncbi:hypothetical protein [Gallaecimonas pentaromativorans]|uniref:Uncharacterized protein n=1 Tax=Gallaecimonas pentaromativorans TaxID=584787 RepID=A0A3N1P5C7_9GAMM|nr:hypothetical protein [Gallaecimonas pentaromativorans]ROQ22671.1 hypothetical protein EDC28_109160 [Gallaecimonas pentaromativorans]
MVVKASLCLAKLKNGTPCSNKGKIEYKGYCGIHRSMSLSKSLTPEEKDDRLVKLLSAGGVLVLLLEKAVEYLPNAIDILVEASRIHFLDPVGMEEDRNEDIDGLNYVKHHVSPHLLPGTIKSAVENGFHQATMNILVSDFEIKIKSGSVPHELLNEILMEKENVVSCLESLGVEKPEVTKWKIKNKGHPSSD